MINRTLVRTKVVQTLFAHQSGNDHSVLSARKTLLNKFSSTYSLYMMMLSFADELTTYAEEQINENKKRAAVLHQVYNANLNFVNNRVAQQLFNNRRLRNYMENEHLRWDTGMSAIETAYKQLIAAPFYKEFMEIERPTYEDEKTLWRKIYSNILLSNEVLYSALDEMEVALDQEGWTIDADMVITYVVKTVKRFKESDSDELPILDMFASEEEFTFAKDLLQWSIEQAEENKALIAKSLKNWEADRIAYMDQIILLVALAEIRCCNEIALEISMNEYIEIAKEYSSDKSHVFVNGVLNKIVTDLRNENQLFKLLKH
jgi:N utilization substance protein B